MTKVCSLADLTFALRLMFGPQTMVTLTATCMGGFVAVSGIAKSLYCLLNFLSFIYLMN